MEDLRRSFSPFAKLLVEIGHSLTKDDLSSMKLLLQADSYLRRVELEQIENGPDLISKLMFKGIISKDDLTLLKNLLDDIRRKDLSRMLCKFLDSTLSEKSYNFTLEFNNHDNDNGISTSVKESDAEYLAQSSFAMTEDDEIPSSQESISDEEKISIMSGEKGMLNGINLTDDNLVSMVELSQE